MKIPSSNLGRTCCVQKLFLTFRTIFVHNIFSPCSAKRRASDKDLPVQPSTTPNPILKSKKKTGWNVRNAISNPTSQMEEPWKTILIWENMKTNVEKWTTKFKNVTIQAASLRFPRYFYWRNMNVKSMESPQDCFPGTKKSNWRKNWQVCSNVKNVDFPQFIRTLYESIQWNVPSKIP